MFRRRRGRYRELAGDRCHRRRIVGEMLQRLMSRSSMVTRREQVELAGHGGSTAPVVQFNLQHEYISNTRATAFRTRSTLGVALKCWRQEFSRGQRRRLSECRAIVMWKLYRQKCAIRRYWVQFARGERYKRAMLLQARQVYTQQQLVRPVCRAWVRTFIGSIYTHQTFADRIHTLVRRIALHWLAKSRKKKIRRFGRVQRLCERFITPNGADSLPHIPVSSNAGTQPDLLVEDKDGPSSCFVLTRPRGLPPPLSMVTATAGDPTRANSAADPSLRYTEKSRTDASDGLTAPTIYSKLSDHRGFLMFDSVPEQESLSEPPAMGRQPQEQPPIDKALICGTISHWCFLRIGTVTVTGRSLTC